MQNATDELRRIELVPYDANWPHLFAQAAQAIAGILQENCVAIHHIGSTAIPGIYAKPIIDILPVVKNIHLVDALNGEFEKRGFICMGEYGIKGRRYYWKSATCRTQHIHLFQQGATEIARHVKFKDFLITNPRFANAYSIIKQNLAAVFPTDAENYTKGKASFIQMIDYKAGVAPQAQLNAVDEIIIQPYNPAWPKLAEAEIHAIKMLAPELTYRTIEHSGGTAVPGNASKPVIEILMTVDSIRDATQGILPLESLGYLFAKDISDQTQLYFFKGMPPFGYARTHQVCIRQGKENNAHKHSKFA